MPRHNRSVLSLGIVSRAHRLRSFLRISWPGLCSGALAYDKTLLKFRKDIDLSTRLGDSWAVLASTLVESGKGIEARGVDAFVVCFLKTILWDLSCAKWCRNTL